MKNPPLSVSTLLSFRRLGETHQAGALLQQRRRIGAEERVDAAL